MSGYRYIWLILVCIAAFFISTDALAPDLMESRNLVTANEMIEYDNWLTPTMNGDLRLEKPPLPTWTAAAIALLVPDSIVAQRCAAGVMAVIWLLFLFLTVEGMTASRRAAMICSLVFLTNFNVVLMGRTATWDIYCHAFMMGAIYLLWMLCYKPDSFRGRSILVYACVGALMGLSFLSKGPVAFFALLLPFIVACAFVCGRPVKARRRWGIVVMIITLLAVSCWWYVYIYLCHSDIASTVLHKESGAWINHNVRPWYYYWRFFTETGVWSLVTLAALLFPLLFKRLRAEPTYIFAVVWMLATVVLLSLMPEKKMRYLLPAMAPCAMAAGLLLDYISLHWDTFRPGRILYRVNGWIVAVITFILAGATLWLWLGYGRLSGVVAMVAAVLLCATAVWMVMSIIRHNVMWFVSSVAALFIVAETIMFVPITTLFSNPEFHSIEAIRHDPRISGLDIYHPADDTTRMELVLAAGHRIRPLDYTDTLALHRAIPCVLLTHKPAAEILTSAMVQDNDTTLLGIFDDNRHPSTDRHYTQYLCNRVYVITPKRKQ